MKNLIYSVLTFIILVSLISYLFDCVCDFKKAIVQPEFIIVYLITYLVANSWFILLAIVIYKTERKTHLSFLRGWDVSDTLTL